MKAVVLHQFGSPLCIETLLDLQLRTDKVIVDVVSTQVVPYSAQVLSAARAYVMDLPIVPGGGAIGRVRAIGPDATRLRVGDWVSCNAIVLAGYDAVGRDAAFVVHLAKFRSDRMLDSLLARSLRPPLHKARSTKPRGNPLAPNALDLASS